MISDVEVPAPQPRIGPSTLKEVLDWPRQLLAQVLQKAPQAAEHMARLRRALAGGLLLNTDFSGMGGPEMAAECMVEELERAFGFTGLPVQTWGSCDSSPVCRKILCHDDGTQMRPQHVFGDLLSRLQPETRQYLDKLLVQMEADCEQFMAMGCEARAAALKATGDKFMDQLNRLMQDECFGLDDECWCFKHKRRCRIHGPSGIEQRILRMHIAGTTCTTWCAIGPRTGWSWG